MGKLHNSQTDSIIIEYRKNILGRIKFIMRKRHIGQEDLALLMGIPQSHVSRIVSGKLNVSIDNLIKMLYYLDCSIEFNDDESKSIAGFWKDHQEWLAEWQLHKQQSRERYALKYINSSPTLVEVD
ncbi:MAG: helix-turn-helix domain-containing protein [Cytophagaceae bacterium]|nr:helix-turn-helix domain-containing protein [Cytophagaceae bacterium]